MRLIVLVILLTLSGCSLAAWEAIGDGAAAAGHAARSQPVPVVEPYRPAPIYAPRQVPITPIRPGYGR